MVVKQAIENAIGFDIDQPVTSAVASLFKSNGYDFCIRYIPRMPDLTKGNLTAIEVNTILNAGLSLSVVQHCARPGWRPTAALGSSYGEYATVYAELIGLPKGMTIWLDLEEVATGTTAQSVEDYCNAWYEEVSKAGYVPGLYVGYNVVITAYQLYMNLKMKSFWKAYNYDDGVATRGFQLIQEPAKGLNGISFDPNRVQKDLLGDLPIFLFNS